MHGAALEIEQESLQLLDWPAVCSQVACFASTPMAADQILQRGLPMGASQVKLLSMKAQLHHDSVIFGSDASTSCTLWLDITIICLSAFTSSRNLLYLKVQAGDATRAAGLESHSRHYYHMHHAPEALSAGG